MANDVSHNLAAALAGDATAAAEMWRAIAKGQASPAEALAWVEHVAHQVVEKVVDAHLDSANRRAEAALKAIGFYGRIDKDRQLREDLTLFNELEGQGAPLTRAEIVETIKLLGHSTLDELPLKQAIKKVDRVRKK